MTSIELFNTLSKHCSKKTTQLYSTSFASAVKLLHRDLQQPIHNIYGFVRLADEIVDTFHSHDKQYLLSQFKQSTKEAIDRRISLNPILNSFQDTVHHYKIEADLINAFLRSMELDLNKINYDRSGYAEYIYGSAEVVGLMCLKVFCEGDSANYEKLQPYAKHLGAAFQKVNFLRDIKADAEDLGRMYFPECDFSRFGCSDKQAIEADIQNDFDYAFKGVLQLPLKARLGVYVAYKYYVALFSKIKRLQPKAILESRIRIADHNKFLIVAKAGLRSQLNLL
jgi:15-cis-phytoene synthase